MDEVAIHDNLNMETPDKVQLSPTRGYGRGY